MTDGYKTAGDLMIEAASQDRSLRDTLVFPIIFNYRHFLEISLKYLLATYGATVGIEPNWHTHHLEMLWGSVLEMLDKYGTSDPDDADSIVGGIILEFAKIDPDSYAYRYSVDRKGKPLPLTQNDLHLPTLADVMNSVSSYFDGCDGYLDNLHGACD